MHVGGRSPSPRGTLIWSRFGAYAHEQRLAGEDPRVVHRALTDVAYGG